jgi:hypothetical protein
MGLGRFLNKLSGKDTTKGGNAFCFVFGADKRFYRRNMESQGSHIQDNTNRLAYFSSPDANGVLSRQINGVERTLGPVSVAYEPITELYGFSYLNWLPDRNSQVKQGGNGHQAAYEQDEILDNSWAEGFSLAAQKQDNTELRNRLLQILLLAVLGTVAMFLLVAASTGLLSDFLSGIPKFFGSG